MEDAFSLWLMPDSKNDLNRKLKDLIDVISQVYKTQTFDPHVTLLGGITNSRERVLNRTRQFASSMKPFLITLGNLDSNENPMQIFFAKVELSNALLSAHIGASEALLGLHGRKYKPHLSLAYGDLTKEQTNVLVDEVEKATALSFGLDGMEFLTWGVSVMNTPTLNPRDWTEEMYFPFGSTS